jgi:hypothetical protein
MPDWLKEAAGPEYAAAILWTVAALVVLLVVLFIVKLIRSMTFGTFVAGGRNRKTRLAVMDATAVDSHRRLVLVRRDDIEHLLLIGGPTDVVVERDIRLSAPRRPALTGDNGHQQVQRPRTQPPAPTPVQPAPARQAPPRQQTPAPPPPREPAPAPRPAAAPKYSPTVVPLPAYGATNAAAARTMPTASAKRDAIDDTLMNELEVSLTDSRSAKPAAKAPPASLDDEMSKLLGELSRHKR